MPANTCFSQSPDFEVETVPEPLQWYALLVKSKLTRNVADLLLRKGYDAFTPYYPVARRLADRNKISDRINKSLDLPVFPGYVFVLMDARYRMPILMTPGVYKIVSVGKQLVPISSLEIHNIRVLMQSGLPIEPCAYLERGQRVEITEGPMRGMVGLLVDTRSAFRIVVSVDAIERSIAVHVERDCVRVLDEAPTCARPATSAPKNRRSESDPALLSKL